MGQLSQLRLVGVPGSNKTMVFELSRIVRRVFENKELGKNRKQGPGSVVFEFDPEVAIVAARYHRTCSRVLWDLYESNARSLEALFKDLVSLIAADQREIFRQGARFSIRERNLSGFAAGARQVVGVVKNALIEGMAERGVEIEVDPELPEVHIGVRMHDDTVIVSVDLLGRSTARRGYKQDLVEAPLREDLAANLLMLARYDSRNELLVDPMCGSGTIACEAALMASGQPLGVETGSESYQHLPVFDDIETPSRPLFEDTVARVWASDLDRRAIEASRKNAERAGVTDSVCSRRIDVRALRRDWMEEQLQAKTGESGLILCNPPYGERLKPEELGGLYAGLGEFCEQFPGWRAAFIVADREFPNYFGMRPRIVKPMSNGGIPATYFLFEL